MNKRAAELLRTELGGTPTLSETALAGGWQLVRAAHRDAAPGTGVATILVSPSGTLHGRHAGSDVAALLDEVPLEFSPSGAKRVAQLIVDGWLDGLFAIHDEPPPTLATANDGLRLTATVQFGLATAPELLVVVVPTTAPATIARTPLPAPANPTPISRAVALERAVEKNDAMAVQSALRAMSAPFAAADRLALAMVVVASSGQLRASAEALLGGSDEAKDALAAARARLADRR